ncbi:glutathione synthase [Roseospira navarrensis]|uniref:Glutathione synthetase n=1 Tax=Roseospira navarrensis TaxID=140058 RepID=A0A7X1ZDW6_9PROT|nr:glutathione synthase [Roseospira navarrensis]MQX36259.1 glutathione synthase [Roseospira navarrensis]
MSLSVAIQMDPITHIDITADSTFVLALEAQARGHTLWHYGPRDLSFRDGKVLARARPMEVRRLAGDHFTLGDSAVLDLATVDVVLMRQDPPFDMAYITATHILDHIHPRTLVVNNPTEVRNAPEKLFVCRWPDLMPPTLVSGGLAEIKAFREVHKDIIVKPLFGNGGAGVFHLKPGDENLGALVEMFGSISREPLMVQRYLPEIRQGDKRIILVDGEPMGAINRIPADGEARSNMHVGGRPVATDLTARDREICAAIGPDLRDRGLIFVGIDVIGDHLTEINVTSPTGLQEVARLGGPRLEVALWDAIERRVMPTGG